MMRIAFSTAMSTLLLLIFVCVSQEISAQKNEESPGEPSTNLHLAALQGDIAAVKQHIEAGSDLNAKDAYGSTPLIIAATFGKSGVARALIEAGVNLDITNNQGSTPLQIAAFFGRTEIVQSLLEAGADKYSRDMAGSTALDIVAAPLEYDIDTYEKIGAALSPLGLAIDYDDIEAARPMIAEMLCTTADELRSVAFTPRSGDDWQVSTPEEQGLDPLLLAELYLDAAGMDKLYGLAIVKNGYLVAESYFNEGAIDHKTPLQSVTKSFTSALVGIALREGCLSSTDQKMMEFFPELAGRVTDPRKEQITVRNLLQMRGGYPWEETVPELFDTLYKGFRPSHLVDIALAYDPSTAFAYSNLTSHLLAVIVARTCDEDFKSYAEANLFSPLGIEVSDHWWRDWDGYYTGHSGIRITLRDAARFGLLYLKQGEHAGDQIVPADWAQSSLRTYSQEVGSGAPQSGRVGRYFHDIGYGYQWWSARVGDHRFNYAAGHGGQLIVLLNEYDMVIVVLSDPFHGRHDSESWKNEQANFNLVGKFIRSLQEM